MTSTAAGRVVRRPSLMGLLAAALAVAVFSPSAVRAAAPEATLAPSPALACLQPPPEQRGKPVYPEGKLERKEGSTVRVRLVFRAPDEGPEVVFERRASRFPADGPRDDFEEAVVAHVKRLRVPCMSSGGPAVELRQEFAFIPNDGRKVAYTALADEGDVRRREKMSCLVRPAAGGDVIRYPEDAAKRGLAGKVVVRLKFTDPARPPAVEIVDSARSASLARAVIPYTEEMRVPCLGAEPLEMMMFFDFRLDGVSNKRYALKDLDLQQFIAAVPSAADGSVYFDTNTMRCPFDVRLVMRQPYEGNRIEALEEDVPSRRPLLMWLASLRLPLPAATAKDVFDEAMTIHVPCAVINL